MIYAVVGSGGKTTWIHEQSRRLRAEGKRVFVTTSTHMYIEQDTLLTDDPGVIIEKLEQDGYVMAGLPEGKKIAPLSAATYETVCEHADVVLVEADGSGRLPVKFPNEKEPVIYHNVNEIVIVCGLHAVGKTIREAAFRKELVLNCLQEEEETRLTPHHIQQLLRKGYIMNLEKCYPDKKIRIYAANDGSLYQRALAGMMQADLDVSLLKEEWFESKPCLFLCGGGHVAKEVAEFASKLDFAVKVMDDREEFANRERFPMAEEVICDSFQNLEKYLERNSFYVVVTRGHQDDFHCVNTIIKTEYRYLGMIGSRKKVAKTFEMLRGELKKEGLPESLIETVHAPIGLSIGAVTPGEIAISILAQIIQEKNRSSNSSASIDLLQSELHGMLCIIIDKTGSTPRGIGSMMLVHENGTIDSVGGGPIEAAVIEDAKILQKACVREYHLNEKDSERLGMICGGSNRILFIPV